jgi:hypothetical protein
MTSLPVSDLQEVEIENDRPIRYHFGRFNLIAVYENKADYLGRGLRTQEVIKSRNQGWGFFDVNLIEIEEENYYSGYLVKYNPEGEEEEVVNLEEGTIEERFFPNSVTAKSRFFLNIRTGVIAFYLKSGVNKKQFKDFFCKIFELGHQNLFVNAEIQDIENDYDFFNRIRRFETIFEVQIYLHPSNPSNNDRWKRIDERIKALNASSYRETIQSKKNDKDLDVLSDEEFVSKAHMAQDGYGKAKVKGLVGGEKDDASTGETPVTALASREGETRNVLQELLPTFKSIFQRTPNKPEGNENNP